MLPGHCHRGPNESPPESDPHCQRPNLSRLYVATPFSKKGAVLALAQTGENDLEYLLNPADVGGVGDQCDQVEIQAKRAVVRVCSAGGCSAFPMAPRGAELSL